MNQYDRCGRSLVGTVVTFNGFGDYIERMATGFDNEPLDGQIGFVIDYSVKYWDDGDGETGPHMCVSLSWQVYVPKYRKAFWSEPDQWQAPHTHDLIHNV